MLSISAFTVFALSSVSFSPASAQSDDLAWGRFRGPNGSGVALDNAPLPETIGPEDNLAWKVELPGGYSSPVLSKDRVFATAVDGVTLLTFAFDRETGEEAWVTESPAPLEAPHRNVNSPAAPTPVTDGENVYVFFQRNGLMSYDKSGELRWHSELDEFSVAYGMGTSPILAGDNLILQCDHDGSSFLLAIDKKSGEEAWRTARPGKTHGFSTPALYEPEGGPAEVIVSGSYEVIGYDAATGEKLWWVEGMAWQAKCLPVVVDDTVYVSSWMASPSEFGAKPLRAEWVDALDVFDTDEDGLLSKLEIKELGLGQVWFLYDLDGNDGLDEEEWGYGVARATAKNGLYAIRLGGRGDITKSHVAWRFRRSLPNVPSPIYYNDHLFVLKEGGVLMSLDPATGEIVQDGRVEGALDTYYASPVAGDGKIVTASHKGLVAVIDAGEEWKVLNVRDFGEEIWATPAVSDGQVFLRTMEGLYCFVAGETEEQTATTATMTEASAGSAQEGDDATWPSWRGPARDGISRETNWNSEGADAPLWSAELGLGYSSVAVANGRLYTLGFDEAAESDVVWCMNAESGEIIWTHTFPAKKWDKFHGGGTNTTPTLDGDDLYALNREGKLHCFDAATGEVRWESDLVDVFGVELPTWGFAASPVVVDDDLLINVGRALLLDKSTGEERWVSEDYGHAYSTPTLFEHKGKPALALFNGKGLAVLDYSDGSQVAFHTWKVDYDINAASPIVNGDNIFISSGYNKGSAMLKLNGGDLEVLWESRAMRNKMSGCVQINGHLFGFDEAILKCIDLKGEVKWSERGLGNGAVSGAGDRVLVMTGEGELIILKATPEEFSVLSRKSVIESDGVFWTTPVVVNGLIYCRDSKGTMVCLDHRKK